jgi:hypothetical protein
MRLVSTAGAGRPSLSYLTQGMRCHQLLAHEAAGVLLGVCAPLDDQPPTYGLCVFDPSSGGRPAGCLLLGACAPCVLCQWWPCTCTCLLRLSSTVLAVL